MTIRLTTISKVADKLIESVQDFTSQNEQLIEIPITADGADVEVVAAIDYSALEILVIFCTTSVTIETNSSSAADDTLTITANKPFVWFPGCGHANPLSADVVTNLFVTEDDSANGDLKIHIGQDATP